MLACIMCSYFVHWCPVARTATTHGIGSGRSHVVTVVSIMDRRENRTPHYHRVLE